MKKIITILGTITLIGTSTASLVACNTPQYTEKELSDLKEKNNIKTKDGVLEWIAPQEKPFSQVDNKYYFVVWRGDKNAGWKIALFKFENTNVTNIDQYGKYIIQYSVKQGYNSGLMLVEKRNPGNVLIKRWEDDNKQEYFKSLYRWNNDSEPNIDVKNKLKSYLDL
ncbi:lipoprotein [Spiroplasma endosymbiont of Polydrusus cervinus]|uniref:lipoprotein n=1 Tax=Spiroplasma endosymbiont of Polydrusus cervinus TaxID=3066287 RepID=UPI0030D10040